MPVHILIYEHFINMRGYVSEGPDWRVARLSLDTDVVFEDSIECDIKCYPGQQRVGCQLPVTTMSCEFISLRYSMASIGHAFVPLKGQ